MVVGSGISDSFNGSGGVDGNAIIDSFNGSGRVDGIETSDSFDGFDSFEVGLMVVE